MTDHPSALVSVPVEPTEAMLDAWHKATWPQGPRVSPLSQQGLSFARAYRAMLSAAPAAPQAAGVGEMRSIVEKLVDDVAATVLHGKVPLDRALKTRVTKAVKALSALRAPSREPEGGAVDDGAFKIATDLHKAYEQLIYGLPKYLDAENLTDEENMIREAWVTLDVTAHRLAALVTREEAPASHVSDRYKFDDEIAWLREAARYFSARDTQGEDRAHWANVYNAENARKLADRLAELSSNPCQLEAPAEAGEIECDGCDGERCVYVGSLCNPSAQPQAREDAQPVISAGRVLADALRQYGFPVSGGAKAALWDHGSAEALALNEACVAFLAALQAEQGAK